MTLIKNLHITAHLQQTGFLTFDFLTVAQLLTVNRYLYHDKNS